MPLYEYKCQSCGKRFEVLQKFSDEPITVHAECGGAAEKLISSPSFHFKGTGWYVTDYAKGNGNSPPVEGKSEKSDKAAEKSEKTDKSEKAEKSEKAPETKTTESKPAESKPAPATTSSSDAK